ncbi:amino acid adenylation domain-containing protein [Acanthopleuribacter pedis]|uniref:Amino acid adenylation domain-containing protein n=1 Tax=Acanthopleuribacter pedis TaxID=442870 RepID=A0A8J7U2G9_9BACT|nr:amino acid adenylation domain-containing protein [Acanthopleuribacter pedis]MBO1319308.1 amino acid adenylation domain-containing protein [Acanthopleuribacter pedis]
MNLSSCLHELIEQQLAATPDALALVYSGDGATLTAGELNRRANRLAWYLRGLGVGPNVFVAILMDRGLEAMVAFLGVLKAGGAYLPLDPDHPQERLTMILEDADVPVVLTAANHAARVADYDGTVLELDGPTPALAEEQAADPPPFATPDDAAYVIYTSGSTGKPKGCIIPHRAIVNRLVWMKNQYKVSEQDRILQKTPFTFDVSVWELFLPMLSGARMVIERPGGHKDNARLIQTICAEGVTICHFVPSMLRFFLNQNGVEGCRSLTRVFTSGEALSHESVVRFRALLRAELHNLYGPTEAAVDVSFWPCVPRADHIVPIGKAIDNIHLHILDPEGKPVATGETGELHIGGVGLALGYLNRPQLTRQKFIRDPFDPDPRARLYKTGDKVRLLDDGNIAFLGRFDFQVKVRGLRIELGEIEAVLRRHPAVREAVVLVREADSDDPRLVAYLETNQAVTTHNLRAFAKTKLPEYMVPNQVVTQDKLPVTRHGKVDRAALPWPITKTQSNTGEPTPTAQDAPREPAPEWVAVLLDMFGEALNVADLGADDDLFDRGATSFTMVRIVETLQLEHGLSVPMDVFLDAPTAAGIAAAIAKDTPASTPVVPEHRAPAATLPARSADPEPPSLLAQLTTLVAEILQTEVQPEDDLFDLGATSFTMVRIVERVQEQLGITLAIDVFLDQPTLAGIAKRLDHGRPGTAAAPSSPSRPDSPRTITLPNLPVTSDQTPTPPSEAFPVDRGRLGRFLSLLKSHNGKYRHASAGGLNPIRAYVLVRAVVGMQPGIYYHHPVDHRLVPVTRPARISAELFGEPDRQRFADAAFAVFLVAHMDAIEPVYQDAAPSLTVLEAGYIAHLLTAHACDFDLSVAAVRDLAFQEIATLFQPEPSEQFLLCLLGGTADMQAAINPWTAARHTDKQPSLDFTTFLTRETGTFPTPEISERLHREKPALRRFDTGLEALSLETAPVDPRLFALRASRRAFLEEPVPFADFAAFLNLLRPNPTHERQGFTPALKIGVYVPANGVVGIDAGVYRYDAALGELTRVKPALSHPLKHCYTPFNRKHAARARFALFLFADERRLRPLFGENSTYAALLEAGRLGQYLMEQQARHSIGICPIGGMLFDKIRGDFGLAENESLVHSFVGGRFVACPPATQKPAGNRQPESATAMLDLAIVGAAGRFPGAPDLTTFGKNLKSGKTAFSTRRYDADGRYHNQGGGEHFGGFLDDIERFDCLFFGITPVEARTMDPQERLLLETAYACLEDAGLPPQVLRASGRTGVYVGAMWDDYQHFSSDAAGRPEAEQAAADHAALANRISYCFDLQGPSVAVNTSCSSALTALHHACVALRDGAVDAALVGGVNLMTHSYHQGLLRHLDMLSPRDQCRAFDREADGWVAGEGVGAVLVKTRAAAERDGDTIHALIRATGIGHTGRTFRFGAPAADSFRRSIQETLDRHQIAAASIDTVEAAAPGAALADAAEFNALNAVFAGHAPRVGTVKPSVGHLESAAAMSQIARVLLQLRHGQRFPSAAVANWNPMIERGENGPELVTELEPWQPKFNPDGSAQPRRALINAFGATGASAHLVLEEAPAAPRAPHSGPVLIRLSAQTPEQRTRQARNLLDFLSTEPKPRLVDIAYTLDIGREHRRERVAWVVDSVPSLQKALAQFLENGDGAFLGSATANETAAVQADDLHGAARQWVAGTAVTVRYPADARRVSLPTYPFAGERHHIAAPRPGQAVFAGAARDNNDPAHSALLERLKTLFAEVTEIPRVRLDEQARFDAYGLTSAMITRLTARLEAERGELPKTLFFEVQTLAELAAYLDSGNESVAKPRATATLPRHLQNEPVAVIGVSGRYPGAPNLDAFWENLKQGVDAVGPLPADRWNNLNPPAGPAPQGGFLDDVYAFDPLFFSINPREAERMDPQERLFLQTVWHTLENAGYSPERLTETFQRRVGVFTGVMYGEYALFSNPSHPDGLTLNSSLGSIANRVSHVLDLHGPSMAVDSLCSSSLTALHLAAASLARGECEAALVGGVNLSLHANKYQLLNELNMTAADGRCRGFGAGATGMVPGEGVGAVLLRPLSAAQRDGDRIIGVIRATAVNHDGHTHGFTVPNPNAQAAMIRDALDRAAIPAAWISYVEAHGTGTPLGDPIEVAGLTQAFATEQTNTCALGTLKSNIGHTEAAAGIAGLTKVLLQMQHATLVPTLHAAEPNPDINFAAGPFFLQQETTAWPRPVVDGRERSRLACISSFGAGGANAHAVLEEAPDRKPIDSMDLGPAAILLSARDEDALRRVVANLRRFLDHHPDVNLHNLAHTLQIGRQAMEERLAFVAEHTGSVRATLAAFEAGDRSKVLRGRIGAGATGIALLNDDADARELLTKWVAAGRLDKIIGLWANGVAVAWPPLPSAQCIPLPGYPFARETYGPPVPPSAGDGSDSVLIHPLVHRNTSDFWEQRFTTRFTGQEFFLADHRVVLADRPVPVLPAVAYLEMARAAIQQATGDAERERPMRLEHVIWAAPLAVGEAGQTVTIRLRLEDADQNEALGPIHFEISTEPGERVVHCQGTARITETPAHEPNPVTQQDHADSIDPDAFYQAFRESGLHHGPAYRALRACRPAADGTFLAEIQRPAAAPALAFVLHPVMMDAALQASAALVPDAENAPALPFALDRVDILGPCTQTMTATVRPNGATNQNRIRKCDIDLRDEAGNLRVKLFGFSSRLLETAAGPQTLCYRPTWQAVTVPAHLNTLVYSERRVLHALPTDIPDAERLPVDGPTEQAYTETAAAVFETVQHMLRRQDAGTMLLQVVLPAPAGVFAGLIGLLRGAHQENPRLITQLIEWDQTTSLQHILATSAALPEQDHVRYRGQEREIPGWVESETPLPSKHALRDKGVYLITGSGALGNLLAEDIRNHAAEAVVYLVGRRPQTSQEPAAAGFLYRTCDVTDRAAVTDLIRAIRREQGALHGIFHAAAVLDDALILHKSTDALRAVLAPKVAGTLHLAEAAGAVDFLALFSSTSGVFGNVGQADYAAANGFLDAFAASHTDLRVLSVNWPLWRDGGMRPDASVIQHLARAGGEQPLPTEQGLAALHGGLASGATRLLVLHGDPVRLRQAVEAAPVVTGEEPTPTENAVPTNAAPTDAAQVQDYFKNLLSETLKLPPHRIRVEEPLERYGIDSILVMQMTNTLETVFGSLSKTLFFEYQTLAELAEYFQKHHGTRLQELLHQTAPRQAVAAGDQAKAPRKHRAPSKARISAATPKRKPNAQIAVVGLAGRYPQAPDLETFWQNLAAGRNSITEVPADRWDWRHWFSEDSSQTGVHLSRWGGFLDDVAGFDPRFFNIAPRDARFMDPQERLFLESCWQAMEDAGYRRDALPERVGVYAGVMYGEYQLIGLQASREGRKTATSNLYASIANRVSYTLNLRGPSMTVDTMCSSSLTCLDLAMRDLRQGRTDMAFAGGVNLNLHPNKYTILSDSRFISNRGYCESFGQGGDGYIPGEGVGVALLKRLDDAQRDHDPIYGVILGSAVNHDGKTNGYTVPNPRAQEAVIAEALAEAGVSAADLSYIEAHGTGTKLGDPIEINGLTRAFGRDTDHTGFCLLGSAKSNIGHCESAAGIAGVTKVLLQMKHGQVAPSLHSATLNPNIDFEATPFVVNQSLRPWPQPASGAPRVAGISSFGAGGANAHLVIREAQRPERRDAGGNQPILLSAINEDRLRAQATQLLAWLERFDGVADTELETLVRDELAALLQVDAAELDRDEPLEEVGIEPVHRTALLERLAGKVAVSQQIPTGATIAEICRQWARPTQETRPPLVDTAYTLMVGREAMPARLGLLVADYDGLRTGLQRFLNGEQHSTLFLGTVAEDATAAPRETLAAWLAARRFDQLLKAWVEGADPDWAQLWPNPAQRPFRVNLPSYPFARKRYWLPEKQPPVTIPAMVASPAVAPAAEPDMEWLAVAETWSAQNLPENRDWQAALRKQDGRRIALIGESEDTAPLRDLLTQLSQSLTQGFQVDTVTPNRINADFSFAARPDVVFLLQPQRPVSTTPQPAEDEVATVFHLSHVFMQTAWNKPLQMVHFHQTAIPRLDLQALDGFLKSAVLENARHRWTCIEADPFLSVTPAQIVLQEWLAGSDDNAEPFQSVRYRGDQRLVAKLEETAMPQTDTSLFREGATYLLTGGLGPVGELLCRELAQRYRARLVILSRGALDEQRRATCRELEKLGAAVAYHAVDIGDRAALKQTLTRIKSEVGPLHGVIHLARLVEDAPILTKTWDSFRRVKRAKVAGTLYLDELTAAEPLDFFVLFSSMGAFGIRGSADYGYSAAFQNAFAVWRRAEQQAGRRAGHTGALCWGFWTVDRYLPANREKVIRESGYDPIDMTAAFPIITSGCLHASAALGLMGVADRDKVLQGLGLRESQPTTRAAVIATQIARWEAQQGRGYPLTIDTMRAFIHEREIAGLAGDLVARLHKLLFPTEAAAASVAPESGPELDPAPQPDPAPSSSAAKPIAAAIRDALVAVLEIEDVSDTHSFPDYGLDSISGMRLTVMLEKKLAREIDAQWLIDFPTIRSLSQHLAAQTRPVMN